MDMRPSESAVTGSGAASFDAELAKAPAAPSPMRTLALVAMSFAVVASCMTLFSIRGDLAYFAAPRAVTRLGDIRSVTPAALSTNTYVAVTGNPMLGQMVEYERAVTGVKYVVFPLAGQRAVFVEMPASMAEDAAHMASREYVGRLVTFGELGTRFATVRGFLAASLGMPVTSESFLIRVGEDPSSATWALGLGILCLIMILTNLALLVRWFRPLPATPSVRISHR